MSPWENITPSMCDWRCLLISDKSITDYVHHSFCTSSAKLMEDVSNPISCKFTAMLVTPPTVACWCTLQIPFRARRFVFVGPPPSILLVDRLPRSSRIGPLILLGSQVSEGYTCFPPLVSLMSLSMLVCFHISHIDVFLAPATKTETVAVHSVPSLPLEVLLHLRMCTPGPLSPSIRGSLLLPTLLWAEPSSASFPFRC